MYIYLIQMDEIARQPNGSTNACTVCSKTAKIMPKSLHYEECIHCNIIIIVLNIIQCISICIYSMLGEQQRLFRELNALN